MRCWYIPAVLLGAVPFQAVYSTGLAPPPPKPATLAMTADVTVVGKVDEIEKTPVDAKPHHGLATDAKVPYTMAVIKVEFSLVGAKGMKELRVGFSDSSFGAAAPRSPLPGTRPAMKLEAGQEGCFFLDRHPSADFYVLRIGEVAVLKSDKDYETVMAEVDIVANAIKDPVATLKAKAAEDRYLAAATVLARGPRLSTNGIKDAETENIPADVNKLVLGVLIETPWNRKTYTNDRRLAPNVTREGLWPYLDAANYGFNMPRPGPTPRGVTPPDMSKERDDATSAFLKANLEKVQLKRMVRGK